MSARASALVTSMMLTIMGTACADADADRPAGLGDAERGRSEIVRLQCGACHTIPGVRAARGAVGPSLKGFARRPHLAGKWPNHPQRLVDWLLDPPALAPHTAMPAVVGDARSARDIAAYLYTLD